MRSLAPSVSLLALCLPVLAQEAPASSGSFATLSVEGAPVHATLDLDSGRLRRRAPALAATERGPCFANDANASAGQVLVMSPGDELYDWGAKSCGGSEFVRSITVGYGSQAVSTAEGGPGASLTLRLYAGGQGGGVAGDLLLSVPLSACPAAARGRWRRSS